MSALFPTLGLIGFLAIAVALIVLARLSQRLGRVTQARPYYLLNYLAALFIGGGSLTRFYFITRGQSNLTATDDNLVYILFIDGLPAIGVTVGLMVTWYYWSWLLAERD
ncbi:MAG: hypothetical protein ACFE0Q_03120 [Anaerolineae bacterium]